MEEVLVPLKLFALDYAVELPLPFPPLFALDCAVELPLPPKDAEELLLPFVPEFLLDVEELMFLRWRMLRPWLRPRRAILLRKLLSLMEEDESESKSSASKSAANPGS